MDEMEQMEQMEQEVRCAECETVLVEGQDRETTEDAVFCRPCFNNLSAQLQDVLAAQGQDINYLNAVVGGLGGAALGVVVWWGFTVLTNIAFGLVAVVIGFAVGKGILLLTGGKRHLNLQILSGVIAIVAYFYASYLVTRSFINEALLADGQDMVLTMLPDPSLFVEVISLGFGFMDVVFLAFVLIQAWKMPAPLKIGG
jgi:hypothetical protein